MKKFIVSLLFLSVLASTANAALILSIDNYTENELAFTISGSFDYDTIGDKVPGYLAIKNDWSNNQGIHTEMFNFFPTITLNTITIGGTGPLSFSVINSAEAWTDTIWFQNPLGVTNPITAGTSVAGSMVLSGNGAFDPVNADSLELLSGFITYEDDIEVNRWARLESAAQTAPVPIPSTLGLLGIGLLGLAGVNRRKKW